MAGTCALAGALAAGVHAPARAQAEGVLVVHTNQRPTVAAIVIEDTLRERIPASLGRPVQIYSEYLDSEWTTGPEYARELAELLRHRYDSRNIRVVVAAAPAALRFLATHRDEVFPGLPVVHVAIPRDEIAHAPLPAWSVGRVIDLDPLPTLQLIARLQPGTERILVVLGAGPRDRAWERRIRDAVARLDAPIPVEYLSALPTADNLRHVASLPRGTVVYTPGYFVDGTGDVSTPYAVVERLAKASSVPVYGALDTFVGTGVVGGSVTPYREQAASAADIAVRLLNGTPVASIDAPPLRQVPMLDWRQLKRWGIEESRMPDDAVVVFRAPPVWEQYAREIAIAFAILLLQAALIAGLLVERHLRKRTAADLQASRAQMDLAVSGARLALWEWNAAPDAARGPPPHRSGPGAQPPLPFGRVLASVHPDDRPAVDGAVRAAVASGDSFDVEYRTVGDDGEERWVSARGRADGAGSTRLLGTAVDVTERRAAERQAEEDRAALRHMTRVSIAGQMTAAIAHQLNQPLAAILGNAETARRMLERVPVDHAELRAICEDIVHEDRRAAEIIRRLGELYKRADTHVDDVDVNRMVRETLDLTRPDLMARRIVPAVELAPDPLTVAGSFVQLQQVVLNLVLNAAEALGGHPEHDRRMTLRTTGSGSEVVVEVADNGPGVADALLERVFDPFFSTKDHGMGMGLAICRSIVVAHGGRIEALRGGGGGAAFRVSLPRRGDR